MVLQLQRNEPQDYAVETKAHSGLAKSKVEQTDNAGRYLQPRDDAHPAHHFVLDEEVVARGVLVQVALPLGFVAEVGGPDEADPGSRHHREVTGNSERFGRL